MLTPTIARSPIREKYQAESEACLGNIDVEAQLPPTVVEEPPATISIPQAVRQDAGLLLVDASHPRYSTIATQRASPLSGDIPLRTSVCGSEQDEKLTTTLRASSEIDHGAGIRTSGIPIRTPSVRSTLSASQYSQSPSSALSSPAIGPLLNMTALPSPIDFTTSPGPWFQISGTPFTSPRTSTDGKTVDIAEPDQSSAADGSPRKRKAYPSLTQTPQLQAAPSFTTSSANITSHHRNRSQSEYVPLVQIPRRQLAVSGSQTPTRSEALSTPPLHREEYLAIQRGITALQSGDSNTPRSHLDRTEEQQTHDTRRLDPFSDTPPATYEAKMIKSGKTRAWTAIKQLGTGAFSTVMLARGGTTSHTERLDPKCLVAVKICEQGPTGGADEKKIESSLKRELEILKAIHHPSLVHLRAVSVHHKQAFLVLNYSPGGDLFELASLKIDLLVPSLIRRIFAELASAVYYLHGKRIVHRDIKLENVLVNVPRHEIPYISNWQKYPRAVVTLTDLGLGRWIPQPPNSPILQTRCGSEDYAAPELLMGQGYDGRATDAWALGVLLYAIMEGRLPFDPIPGSRKKSPTSHRIARCEWSWVRHADEDGEWEAIEGNDLEGGRECVEGLLVRARSRFGLEKLRSLDWVRGGEMVEGGLSLEEEDENE